MACLRTLDLLFPLLHYLTLIILKFCKIEFTTSSLNVLVCLCVCCVCRLGTDYLHTWLLWDAFVCFFQKFPSFIDAQNSFFFFNCTVYKKMQTSCLSSSYHHFDLLVYNEYSPHSLCVCFLGSWLVASIVWMLFFLFWIQLSIDL